MYEQGLSPRKFRLAVMLLMGASSLAAQAVSGTILGRVIDVSGAPVVNARVSVKQELTGFQREVVTGSDGEYSLPLVPTGKHEVRVEAAGFRSEVRQSLELSVDQKARLDFQLQVGAVSESLTVQATTPLLQSDTSELAAVMAGQQIRDLPLNGRNFIELTRLVPGTLRGIPGRNIDGSGSFIWRASASLISNGMRARDNNFILDGVDNNESFLNSVVIFPNVDALEEFKIQTSTYSAEFGRSNGAVVNLQVKSGSNEWHGSAFEFLRNDKLDANDWFNNRSGRPRPSFKQNQFGGTIGGKIIENKTFFFADYQGGRLREGRTYLSTIPSLAMKRGDFSELNRVIFDATNQTPFPGNVIPSQRGDRAAMNIIRDLYPEPNVPGRLAANGQTIQNYLINPTLIRDDDQGDVKVDHRFHPRNQAFVRYSMQRTQRFLPPTLPNGDGGTTGGSGNGLIRAQGLAINDTHTIKQNWINEFRFGFSRYAIKADPIGQGTKLADKVGIPGVNINDSSTGMAMLRFIPEDIRLLGPNPNLPLRAFLDTFQFIDNMSIILGRHSLKVGGSLTARRRNFLNQEFPPGQWTFNQPLTSNCAGIASGCSINANTGFTVASFYLGYASAINRSLMDGIYGERRREWSAYIQDDYRVNRRLTLNLGLRYDIFRPFVEVYNRQSNFDVGTGRFIVASPNAQYSDGRSFGNALRRSNFNNFGPRLGFAYDLFGSGKTLVRGGYAMFYNSPLTGSAGTLGLNPPFLKTQSLTTAPMPTLILSNGIAPPPPVNPNAEPQGASRSLMDPDMRDSRAIHWNLNVQRSLRNNFLIEAAYAASRATRLEIQQDINSAPPVLGVTNLDINRPFIVKAPLLRRLAQTQSRGYSFYHSLQMKAQKRFQSGFSFLAAYTWSKAIDIVSDGEQTVLNFYDINYNRGVADFNVPHNFNFSGTYELPFGKGRTLLAGANGLTDKLVSGWQLGSVVLMRSGLPFTVTQQQGVLSTGTGNRPDRIGSGKLDQPSVERWFDLRAFTPTRENTATYGNAGRNILMGPRQHQFDLSLIKNTKFNERFSHQFRFEVFNALNRAQFGFPGSVLGTGNAGVINNLLFQTPMRQMQFGMKLMF